MTAAYSQLTASMHCAPAGNLIGAAGAQALLQAVRSSTGRLTAMQSSLDIRLASQPADWSHGCLRWAVQPCCQADYPFSMQGCLAAGACRGAVCDAPCQNAARSRIRGCAAGNPCEQEAPAILQSIELALQRNRCSAWVVPEAQGSPGPASGRSALFSAAAVCITSGWDPAVTTSLLPWHVLSQCMPVAAAQLPVPHPAIPTPVSYSTEPVHHAPQPLKGAIMLSGAMLGMLAQMLYSPKRQVLHSP